jgi:hypothetical protein
MSTHILCLFCRICIQMSIWRKLLIASAVTALAVPAVAIADPGSGHRLGAAGHGPGLAGHGPGAFDPPGRGHRHHPVVAYVFKGTFDGTSSVDVAHGNRFVRRGGFVGTTVEFDLTDTRLTVADTSGDGVVDISDVLSGDQVVIIARLPKRDPGSQPFAARRLIDQTNPPPETEPTD